MQVRRPGPWPGPGHGFRFIIYYHRYVLLICPNDDDGDDEDENKSVVTTDSGIYCNNGEPTTVSFFSSRLLEMSVDSSQMTKWRNKASCVSFDVQYEFPDTDSSEESGADALLGQEEAGPTECDCEPGEPGFAGFMGPKVWCHQRNNNYDDDDDGQFVKVSTVLVPSSCQGSRGLQGKLGEPGPQGREVREIGFW